MTKFNEKISKNWRKISKNTRRNLSIALYAVILVAITTVVYFGYQSPIDSQLGISRSSKKSDDTVASSMIGGKNAYLDEVTEASFATGIADNAQLSIANAVREKHSTLSAKRAMAQNSDLSISKPSITIGDSDALTTYTAVKGDNVKKIAAKFGISMQTVKWANNLIGDKVPVGKVLTIPSVNGVVYTVKTGDKLNSIATKYKSEASRIVALNALGGNKLVPGETIVIPGGTLPLHERPGYVAPTPGVWYPWGSNQATVYSGNRYYWGQCVWYAYNERARIGRPVGSLWGNANTWDYYAKLAGYTVNQTPAVGAVFQTKGGYYGHVGVVERINADGSIYVSEMNYVGVGVKSYRTITNPKYDPYAGTIVYIH